MEEDEAFNLVKGAILGGAQRMREEVKEEMKIGEFQNEVRAGRVAPKRKRALKVEKSQKEKLKIR